MKWPSFDAAWEKLFSAACREEFEANCNDCENWERMDHPKRVGGSMHGCLLGTCARQGSETGLRDRWIDPAHFQPRGCFVARWWVEK